MLIGLAVVSISTAICISCTLICIRQKPVALVRRVGDDARGKVGLVPEKTLAIRRVVSDTVAAVCRDAASFAIVNRLDVRDISEAARVAHRSEAGCAVVAVVRRVTVSISRSHPREWRRRWRRRRRWRWRRRWWRRRRGGRRRRRRGGAGGGGTGIAVRYYATTEVVIPLVCAIDLASSATRAAARDAVSARAGENRTAYTGTAATGTGGPQMKLRRSHFERHHVEIQCAPTVLHIYVIHAAALLLECHFPNRGGSGIKLCAAV